MASSAAVRALQLEMRNITRDPVEGVLIELQDESNLFEWSVGVFGPPKTLYEGGYFNFFFFFFINNNSTHIHKDFKQQFSNQKYVN